jgi:hypothetical protein
MTSSDFRAWLERHAFTYEVAAVQLGISRRLIGYYAGTNVDFFAEACLIGLGFEHSGVIA